MRLSTSSFRPIFGRVFLIALLGMSLSLGLVRALTFVLDKSGSQFLGRVLEARAALPEIAAEEDDLVMFFGSSILETGFSARVFDDPGGDGVNAKTL